MKLITLLFTLMLRRQGNAVDASTENSNFTTGGFELVPLLSGRSEHSKDQEVFSAELRGRPYDLLDFSSVYKNVVTNVTFQASKTAYLPCSIHQLKDKKVSWVRKRDLSILTIGKTTYTTDLRFSSIHLDNSDVWTLEIRDTCEEDSGVYECQVYTERKRSLGIQLNIIVVEVFIAEGPILSVKSGNPVNMTCHVKDQVGTIFIFWYKDGKVLDADEKKQRGIYVITELGHVSISRLFISKAKLSDSAIYSCQPSYSKPANVILQVLNDEKPVNTGCKNAVFFFLVVLLTLVFLME